jgi:hypothetical protein
VTEHRSQWPFPPTDGGPLTRPRVVDLSNVLVAIVADLDGAERSLRSAGYTDECLRTYSSEQIVASDEAFRSERGPLDRAIGLVVDDREAMSEYVQYGRDGRSALWVRVTDRDDANRVVRHLLDDDLIHVWFHGERGLEILHCPS